MVGRSGARLMASLGSLGTPRDPVDLDFVYFGQTIRVNPDATDLDVADMMAQFGHVDDETQTQDVMGGLRDMLLQPIHPDDRDEFWRLAKANRQRMNDIMTVGKTITEAVSGFPTGQPSDSSTGPMSTVENFEGVSFNRADRRTLRRRKVSRPTIDRALSALDGRPDKQLGLLQLNGLVPAPEEEATG